MRDRITSLVKWASALTITLMSVYAVGPAVEAKLFPPFSHVSATMVGVGPDFVDVIVTGVKRRDCLLRSAVGYSQINGHTVLSQVTMLKQDGTVLRYDEQRINAGAPFVRLARIKPGGDNVKVVVETNCHPFWSTTQTMVDISP